jgi:glutathione S-transferase
VRQRTEQQQIMLGYGSMDLGVPTLRAAVSAHDCIAGCCFSAADVYVGSQIGWGCPIGVLAADGGFARSLDRVTTRGAAVRAREKNDVLAGEIAATRNG